MGRKSRYEIFEKKKESSVFDSRGKKHTNCVINAGWDLIMSYNNFTLMEMLEYHL